MRWCFLLSLKKLLMLYISCIFQWIQSTKEMLPCCSGSGCGAGTAVRAASEFSPSRAHTILFGMVLGQLWCVVMSSLKRSPCRDSQHWEIFPVQSLQGCSGFFTVPFGAGPETWGRTCLKSKLKDVPSFIVEEIIWCLEMLAMLSVTYDFPVHRWFLILLYFAYSTWRWYNQHILWHKSSVK